MLNRFSYIRPESLDEAIRHLSTEGARLHAGGTDLLGCLREQIFEVKKLVSISAVKKLHGISRGSGGGVRIGALTTIAEVAKDPILLQHYTALSQAAGEIASPQLRNQGTIGGNICQKPRCWYYRGDFHCLRKGGTECFAEKGENAFHCIFGGVNCFIVHPSDAAPALAALGARVHIKGSKGERSVAVEDFFILPEKDYTRETVLEDGEIVTDIELPPPVEGLRSSYRKVRARRSWDFSLAGAALALVFDGNRIGRARVFLSGAAPIPWRATELEETITGKRIEPGLIRSAAEAAVRNAQPLAQNGYKVPLFRGVIEEALESIVISK